VAGRPVVTGRRSRRGCRGWQGRVPGRGLERERVPALGLGLVPELEMGWRQLGLVSRELLGIPGY